MSGSPIDLPEHKCGLFLEHNAYRNYYQCAADWLNFNTMFEWKDEEAKQRALTTGDIWTLQWYPDTPVGFCAVAAPTLAEVLELANQ